MRKGTKQAALVDCIKHLQALSDAVTLWELRDELPFFHDNIVTNNMHLPDLYTTLYKIGVSTGLCEVRFRVKVPKEGADRWDMRDSDVSIFTPAEYRAYRKDLPDGHRDVDYRAVVFILASAEHYQKRMDAKKASEVKKKKKYASTDVRQQVFDTLKVGPVPMQEKSFYDRVAKRYDTPVVDGKRSAFIENPPRFSYDTPVVEDGDINMPQLPTSQEVYNAKTDAEIDRQLKTITRSNFSKHWGEPCKLYCDGCPTCNAWDDWTAMTGEVIKYEGHDEDSFTDEFFTPEDKLVVPEEESEEESDPEPTGYEHLKTLHIDMSYTRIALCISAGIFVGITASNLITSLFI